MNRRFESRRGAALPACTLSLALLAATAAPGWTETAPGASPAAAQTGAVAKAPATGAAPAKAKAAPKPQSSATQGQATVTTAKPAGQTTAAATTKTTTAKSPAAGATAAGGATKAPAGTADPAGAKAGSGAKPDGDYTLRGGQEGTVFKSLTVEGEDRVHVDFERPELKINLDLEKAPGLEWGSAADVLNRSNSDLQAPLTTLSAKQMTPYLARPWLSGFASGPVARFRPEARGVERWKLLVVDSKGTPVTTFSGKGDPPDEITWDGRAANGAPVTPGLTYSYVFEAFDRAGNKRNVVGQGFSVTAYRMTTPDGPVLLFSATELTPAAGATLAPAAPGGSDAPAAPPLLLEAASWLNQTEPPTRPIRVTATARSLEQADQLAASVKRALAPHVVGDPARLEAVAVVEADAPEAGTLAIAITR